MKKHSIILIDDNPDDCESLVRGFQTTDLSCVIKWYDSPEKYLDYLSDIDYDHINNILPILIILDLNMPGIDGKKMLGIIKANDKIKAVPVIILTTSTNQDDILECYANGANTYIQKPMSFEKMKKICDSLHNYWFKVARLPQEGIYPL